MVCQYFLGGLHHFYFLFCSRYLATPLFAALVLRHSSMCDYVVPIV